MGGHFLGHQPPTVYACIRGGLSAGYAPGSDVYLLRKGIRQSANNIKRAIFGDE